MPKHVPYPIILASASPRRRELMHSAGYTFDVVPPDINEPALAGTGSIPAVPWAEALAYFKARVVAQTQAEAIIIGADTIVTHGERIIGKPRDREDARRILTHMFGGNSDVITGLAVLCPAMNKRVITHDLTTLTMRDMIEHEIEAYLDSGAWHGKAGAYALQEGGDRFLQSMTGSFSNVVGLPMEKLEDVLELFREYDVSV